MDRCFYAGSVPMMPEMEKRDFVGEYDDYNMSYQMPEVYFECDGEVADSKSAFKWNNDSLVIVKDNCIVKFTDSKFYDVLVKDIEGKNEWLECRLADIYGLDDEDVEDSVARKRYTIEEYDLEKREKRRYQVVLQETAKMNHIDESYVQDINEKSKDYNRAECVLTENE